MGVDYTNVSGVGIILTDEMVDKFIEHGGFTREEYEEDDVWELEQLGFKVQQGNWTGDELIYLTVEGKTFVEVTNHVSNFIQKLQSYEIRIDREDLLVLNDIRQW